MKERSKRRKKDNQIEIKYLSILLLFIIFFKLISLGESFSLLLMASNYPGCFILKINAELVTMMLFCSAH